MDFFEDPEQRIWSGGMEPRSLWKKERLVWKKENLSLSEVLNEGGSI